MAVASVRALVEAGDQVDVVLPSDGPLVPLLTEAGARVLVLPLPVLRKAMLRPLKLLQLAATMPRTIVRSMRVLRRLETDVVYVNTITQPWWLLAAALAKKPRLVHVREAESEQPAIVRRVLLAPLALATRVVCNSKATERYVLDDASGVTGKTSVLYNGKDWAPYEAPAFEGFAEPVRLLLVGRISPRKGTDTAIEAVHLLRQRGIDTKLTLIGDVFDGYEWYRDELGAQIAKHGLEDAVVFAGFDPEPAERFGEADLVLVPSRLEPFGTVAAEGMAAGRCTIVARTQGLVEIVDSAEVGLTFEAENAGELAEACAQLIADPDRAVAMAAAGRARVLERFSTEQYAAGTRSIVAELEKSV
ncbi:glycosyltransferase family 4 protein [Pseudoclavibacter sp. AY1H1]|uniref:glycosyltransferase family 4 protein n=1 Tax=Pseudoclavibacter sp. AY1H1 TaxID=2080584 RepID=UPI000CE8D7F3|nr:glycosyltransferase family 4 protein [Pseudoclavibacter sp. AY1H1]PPF34319.1 glycosyl transferase family 1 [Pseudoclavibacter sp. AY1H1]